MQGATSRSSRTVRRSPRRIPSAGSRTVGMRSSKHSERAASNFRDGHTTGFETIERLVTPDLAYTLEIERYVAKLGGSSDLSDIALRVSCMYRLEGGVWKLLHRHADPRVGPQTPESLIQS